MPKLTKKLPAYRLHKRSRQAIVTLSGHDIYLGPYGSHESKAAYERQISEWLANRRQLAPSASVQNADRDGPPAACLTMDELFVAYWDFAKGYYVKNGRPTSTLYSIQSAYKPLHDLYGNRLALQRI